MALGLVIPSVEVCVANIVQFAPSAREMVLPTRPWPSTTTPEGMSMVASMYALPAGTMTMAPTPFDPPPTPPTSVGLQDVIAACSAARFVDFELCDPSAR